MNLKQFIDPDIEEDWEITNSLPDLQHLRDEILWELKEYEGDTTNEFAVLHDKTIFQILVILNIQIATGDAEGYTLDALRRLAEQ